MNPTVDLASPFDTAIRDAKNLVEIHRQLNPQKRRGRRSLEGALNRSIVVLAVAAWQVQVEVIARHLLEELRPDPLGASRLGRVMFALMESNAKADIGRYSSPNAQNTIRLLGSVGYEVEAQWRWQHGPKEMLPAEAKQRLDDWVRVRHAIAHGSDLPKVKVITSTNKSGPSVRLSNAESCLRFLAALAYRTREGALRMVAPESETSTSSDVDEEDTTVGDFHARLSRLQAPSTFRFEVARPSSFAFDDWPRRAVESSFSD